MSEKFTASNGKSVELRHNQIRIEGLDDGESFYVGASGIVALREYYTAERDQELGRWRYNSYLVIYQAENHQPGNRARSIYVLDERTAKMHMRHEGQAAWRETDPELTTAAASYFAAHPLPKPWHDAQHEEAWLLTVNGDEGVFLAEHNHVHGSVLLRAANGTTVKVTDDEQITAGRRIWPEAVES